MVNTDGALLRWQTADEGEQLDILRARTLLTNVCVDVYSNGTCRGFW
jgi:hypothetical protein